MVWTPYWSVRLRGVYPDEYEATVEADGRWEICDIPFGNTLREGTAPSVEEAKREALGAFGSLVEWEELASLQFEDCFAWIRPRWLCHHGLVAWNVGRGSYPDVATKDGEARSLEDAKHQSERAIEELRSLPEIRRVP